MTSFLQAWMEMHTLPERGGNRYADVFADSLNNDCAARMNLLPATTYVVVPPLEALQQYGLSWSDMHRLQVLFMVTDEMVGSCITYMDALNTAGFDKDCIGIDIDGKRKLVRNNWELITLGCRRLRLSPGTTRHRQTFVPFGCLVAPSESWQAIVYGYEALREAIRRVFGRKLNFLAQNADAHGATNKAAVALKLEVSSICFTHVIIAPCNNMQRHLLNGTQVKKDEFLNEVVKPDVTSIHLCQTTEQAMCQSEAHGVGGDLSST